jgi:hypothetical protein
MWRSSPCARSASHVLAHGASAARRRVDGPRGREAAPEILKRERLTFFAADNSGLLYRSVVVAMIAMGMV